MVAYVDTFSFSFLQEAAPAILNMDTAPQAPEPPVPTTSQEQQQGEESSNHNSGYTSDPRGSHFNTPTNLTDDNASRPNSSSPSLSSQTQQSAQLSRPPSSGGARQPPAMQQQQTKNSVVIKVGMVGDAQIGKTSLMVKYVEGSWDEDYIQTLGVNFMEKTISIRNTEITFSIWDLGGQREFVNMLPLVCNDAVAILFMFDLTRKSTLNSIKEWYRQGRGFNKTAIPFLVGTKYDHFVNFPREDQEEISVQV